MTSCRRREGDIIGLYGGSIVEDTYDYSDSYLMQFHVNGKIVTVDGTPPKTLDKHDCRITSLANEYI